MIKSTRPKVSHLYKENNNLNAARQPVNEKVIWKGKVSTRQQEDGPALSAYIDAPVPGVLPMGSDLADRPKLAFCMQVEGGWVGVCEDG